MIFRIFYISTFILIFSCNYSFAEYLITYDGNVDSKFVKKYIDEKNKILKNSEISIISQRISDLYTVLQCVNEGYISKDRNYDLQYSKFNKKYKEIYFGERTQDIPSAIGSYKNPFYNRTDVESQKFCSNLVAEINKPISEASIKKKPVIASFVNDKRTEVIRELYISLGNLCRSGSKYAAMAHQDLSKNLLAVSAIFNYYPYVISLDGDLLFKDDKISSLIFASGVQNGKKGFFDKVTKEDYDAFKVKWIRFQNIGYKVDLKWVHPDVIEIPSSNFFTDTDESFWLGQVDY